MSLSRGNRSARRALLALVAVSLAASLTAIVPTTAGAAGLKASAAPTEYQLAHDEPTTPASCGKPPMRACQLTRYGRQAPTLVLWGDSHMWMMIPAVVKAARAKRVNVVLFFLGGCVPSLPDMKIYAGNDCAELAVDTLQYVQRLEESGRNYRLMLGAFWGANLNRVYYYDDPERTAVLKSRRVYTQDYTRPLFRWLGRNGIPTDVSFQGPASVPSNISSPGLSTKPPADCAQGTWPYYCSTSRYKAHYKEAYIRGWLANQMSHLPRGAKLVDFTPGICTKRICPGVVNGVHTWFDPYHVSATKAATLASFYKPSVRATLTSR